MPKKKNKKAVKKVSHPYHYDQEKTLPHRFLDFGIPLVMFYVLFNFYNNNTFSPQEMAKTSGLMAILLLGLTLFVGPLSRIAPFFSHLKAHRKVWGVLSFWVATLHMLIIVHFYWKWNIARFIDVTNPRYSATLTGTLALIILALVTMTSTESAIRKLTPALWKMVQTTSYIAMFFAAFHFYIVSMKVGGLEFRNNISEFTLYFSVAVILLRLLVIFLPNRK